MYTGSSKILKEDNNILSGWNEPELYTVYTLRIYLVLLVTIRDYYKDQEGGKRAIRSTKQTNI